MLYEKEKPLISVRKLCKSYEIYEKTSDRLKQILWGDENRKYYKEFHALSDVSFEVPRGSSFAVIGKNGAGKSTLLQLITGTLQPTSGKIEVNGRIGAVLELGAGFNPEFSGKENIELYCNLMLMQPAVIKRRFAEIVAFSELQDFIDQPLKTYSSGMVARLAFSVVAHIDADILIIDEALSVGDASFSQKCMRFLREFKKHGSIFFVSHDLSAVKSFCDSAVWLEHGMVRALGESAKVCDAYLADVYPNKHAVAVEKEGVSTKNRVVARQRSKLAESDKLGDSASFDKGAIHIEGFNFNPESSGFGNGNANILSVCLVNDKDIPVDYCEGQTKVQVVIEVEARATIESPIVGFFVKDRLGQPLFGGNTYRTYEGQEVQIEAGQIFEVIFGFMMPTLMIGDYSITVAVADGTLEAHAQLHWMHDAAMFKVTSSSLDGVLVGIPIQEVEIRF